MWYVYFIRSCSDTEIIYVGHTQNIRDRLQRHNEKRERYTKKFVPFELIYTEEFVTKEEAAKREYYFKTPKGRAEKRIIIRRLIDQRGV